MGKPLINNTDGSYYALSGTANIGQLQASFVARGQANPGLFLQEVGNPTTVYEVKIFNGGMIGTFLAPGKTGSAHIWLDTADPTKFLFLAVKNGRLVSDLDQPFLPTLVVGQLYPGDGTRPTPKQPGGPGTPVTFPTITQGESLGNWTAGCSHWFQNWELVSAQIGGVTSCLVVCPLCGYVQRIIQPYSAANPEKADDLNSIIFA